MAKFISTFLSFLILLGSSGIAYSQHFCGGKEVIAEITVGHSDLSCGMSMDENGCCDNHSTKVKTDENYSVFSQTFSFDNNLEVLLPAFNFEYVFVEDIQRVEVFSDCSPPPLEKDLNILYETFLI